MTLTRLSWAKSLRDPLVSQLLGEWVASSPLAKARWAEATEVGYPTLIRNKQKEAVKQYASLLFPAPHLIGLLMELNVTKTGCCHLSAFMTRRGLDYTATTGHFNIFKISNQYPPPSMQPHTMAVKPTRYPVGVEIFPSEPRHPPPKATTFV